MQRAFRQVDVFTATPYLGNPVAVVLDGTDLTDEQMQRLARWTNLSETTFVLPPAAPEAPAPLFRALAQFAAVYSALRLDLEARLLPLSSAAPADWKAL